MAPQLWPLAWGLLLPIDLLVPAWAERARRTTFHPEHIAERYGLFMIIVLGESVLATSLAIQGVLGASGLTFELVAVIVGSLLIVYARWWIYFDRPEEHLLDSVPTAIAWSYLHLPIFAAVAAVGAGLVAAIEGTSGHNCRTSCQRSAVKQGSRACPIVTLERRFPLGRPRLRPHAA